MTINFQTKPEVDPLLFDENCARDEFEVCENYFECLSVDDDDENDDNHKVRCGVVYSRQIF